MATHYFSWRYGQWGLFVLGLLVLIPVYFCLPETLDPEKRRRWGATEESKKPIFLNPFKSLGLLRSPNMVLVVSQSSLAGQIGSTEHLAKALVGTTAMVTNFVLMIPLAYTIVRLPLRRSTPDASRADPEDNRESNTTSRMRR